MTTYICNTYIADGKTVSSVVHFSTAKAAKERAEEWRRVGTKAKAFKVDINPDTYEMNIRPLD
jgi:hypothetical protein